MMRFILCISLLFLYSCYNDNNFNEVSINIPNYNHSKYHVNFSTDNNIIVDISYWSDENNKIKTYESKGYNHDIILPFLKPSSNYSFKIRSSKNSSILYSFKTRDLPKFFPSFVLERDSLFSFDGYLFFRTQSDPGIQFMMDDKGDIIWYNIADTTLSRPYNKGDYNSYVSLSKSDLIHEIRYDGDTLFSKNTNNKILHHDILKNNNKYVGLTYEYLDFKRNSIDSLIGDGIVVYDSIGNNIWEWNIFDHVNPLDENYKIQEDWSHANAIDLDNDGNYLISFRSFDQIWKINSKSGDIIWKLGENGDFDLTSEELFYQQHAIHKLDNSRYMLFDNGMTDKRKTTRALIFSLDEENKTFIHQNSIFLPDSLFSFKQGSVYLMDDNKFLFASSVNNKTVITDTEGKILWNLSSDHSFYRVYYLNKEILLDLL